MRRSSFLLLFLSLLTIKEARADLPLKTVAPVPMQAYGRLPLAFESNQGQIDSKVKFLSRGEGYTLYLTEKEAVLALKNEGKEKVGSGPLDPLAPPSKRTVLRMKTIGALPHPTISGSGILPGKSNYFIGNDPSKWRRELPIYSKVIYQDVYSGIDLIYYGNQRQLEYDFVVKPGANPNTIALEFDGTEGLTINQEGDLILKIKGGEVSLHRPYLYQQRADMREVIPGQFILKGKNKIGFEVGKYDRTIPLMIDPILRYSTYLGGAGDDAANSIAADGSGNIYVTGETSSIDFPTTTGAFQTSHPANLFVSKLNPSGTALIYSTYLGGNGKDRGLGIAVDASGKAYITGETSSSDFPITQGAFQTTSGGPCASPPCTRGFITKLNSSGSALEYSTYLGGSRNNTATAIAVDSSGRAFVTGSTNSADFPTKNPIQSYAGGTCGGQDRWPCYDAFVSKLNAEGSALIYSTYLGGASDGSNQFNGVNGDDEGNSIAIDNAGNAYVTGQTNSPSFPVKNAIQLNWAGGESGCSAEGHTPGGCADAFVTKVNETGSALIYSTYLGGRGRDVGTGIAVDASNNVYVTGSTSSPDFPLANPLQPSIGKDPSCSSFALGEDLLCPDAFVTKINQQGTAWVFSTYLGGGGYDYGNAISVDASSNVYVVGSTESTNFPTKDPIQSSNQGRSDAFISKLNPLGSALIYSTYLGGNDRDSGNSIVVDSLGNAYLAGATTSSNFLTTPGIFQTTSHGGSDAFVAKIFDPSSSSGASSSDDFNRPDSTDLGPFWNEYLPDLMIVGQEVTNAANQNKAAVITNSIGPDQDVSVDCKVSGPGSSCGIMARWSSEQNFYRARLDVGQGNLTLTKTVGGETTILAAVSRPLQPNVYYRLRLVLQGASLSLFFGSESSPALSITDTSLTQGNSAGIRAYAAAPKSVFFDNFSAAALSSTGGADMAISMSANPTAPIVGNSLIYQIVATNQGLSNATEVTLTDTLPDGVTLVSATASQGSCSIGSGKVTCSLGTLAGHAAATVNVVVTPNQSGSINNIATISAKESDPNPKNNQTQLTTPVAAPSSASADLSVSISASPDPIGAGSNLTYTLTVSNAGADTAEEVTLSDILPEKVSLVSVSPTSGSCSATVVCVLGAIAPSTSATVTLVVTPTIEGTLSSTAVVTSVTSDSSPANNTATLNTPVTALPIETTTGGTAGGGTSPVASASGGGGGGCALVDGRGSDSSLSFLMGALLCLLVWKGFNKKTEA